MHYQWQNPQSVIQDIDIYTPGEKQSEALIYAPENLDMSALAKIPALLRDHGFTVSADNDDAGKPVLRVENFQNKGDLLSLLDQQGLIQGVPTQSPTDNDIKEKKGFSTIKAAGWTYLLADSLIALSGFMRGSPGEGLGGTVWAAGSVGLIAAGEKDPELQTGRMYRGLNDHLRSDGTNLTINQQHALDVLSEKPTVAGKLQNALFDYPIEFNNSIQVAGGLLMAKGGLEQKNPLHGTRNWFKVGAGVSVAGGMGSGMLLDAKENPYKEGRTELVEIELNDDEKKAAAAGLGPQKKIERRDVPADEDNRSTWEKIKEAPTYNPMIWSGVGPSINNALNMWGAGMWERKTLAKFDADAGATLKTLQGELKSASSLDALTAAGKNLTEHEGLIERSRKFGKGYKLNLGAGVVNLVANGLYGMSEKDTGVSLQEFGSLSKMYNVTAHIVLAQPAEQRTELIERMAGYFSAHPEVKECSTEVAKEIWQKVDELSKNPWMKAEGVTQVMGNSHDMPMPVINSVASAEVMNDSHMNAQGRA